MSYARFIFIAVVAFAACKKDASTTGAPAQEAMGLYAEGFNTLIKDPKSLIRDYFQSIPDSGPDEKSKPHLFPYQNSLPNKIKDARAAFDKAKASAPKSLANLAPAADQAIAAVERLEQIYSTAQKYYDAENYKDDQFAKGKELHAQMIAVTKDFNAAIGKLENALSSIEDEQAAQELAKFADNKGYSYWFRHFNMQAKKFLGAVEAAQTPEQLAKLEEAFHPISTAYDELNKFVATKSAQVNATFGSYAKQVDSFHAAGTKVVRLAKAPKLEEADFDREAQNLVARYNSIVDFGNTLYKLEAQGLLK